jgi:ABC-type transport system, involved in lipoprotein release, permease component
VFKIAFRNVLRNGRRSLMTAMAIIVGASALVLLGEYNAMIKVGMETGIVRGMGHLQVFKTGYFTFGSGKPAAYSIADYEKTMATIRKDPQLASMIAVITPRVSLGGIAGNAAVDKSKTFFGSGLVPSDKDRMNTWDAYGITGNDHPKSGLDDARPDQVVVGVGLARILGLCRALKLKDCTAGPQTDAKLQLLSGGGGAPNIVTVTAVKASGQGAKEMDDSYIGLHFAKAQQLLYGGDLHKATAIVIQLKQTADIARAKARLVEIFARDHLDLEVKDFDELYPSNKQILGYFMAMFAFIGVVMAIIVGFTIANTMSMSVMERTNEIGTARAMGVRRGGVHRQFLLEGAILGGIGATAGIAIALALTYFINHAGITYTPPGNAAPVDLTLLTNGTEGLLATVWILLTAIATLASIIPANRASRMKVVDALRHV